MTDEVEAHENRDVAAAEPAPPATDATHPAVRPRPWHFALAIMFAGIAVGALLWQLQEVEPQPQVDLTPPGDYVVKCEACDYELNNAERDRLTGDVQVRPGLEMRMECPKCGELTARFAERCPNDGTVFFPTYADLTPGPQDRCPKCGWSRLDAVRKELGAAAGQ